MKHLLALFLLTVSTSSFSQEIVSKDLSADFSTHRLAEIPTPADDQETQKLLRTMAKSAGWFPDMKIDVAQGIVQFTGRAKEAKQVKWLKETADRLPTVIAVVNKVEIETPAYTDMTPFFKEMNRIANLGKKNLPTGVLAVLMATFFLFLGFYIQKGLRALWYRRIDNPFLASTVSKLNMLPIWVLFFYLTLLTIGLQNLATTIIGGTGVIGIVLGFAFKGIAENFLSGLLLAIRSPFTKGDLISVDNVKGVVQNLNMRGTTIMNTDGNLVLIPNTNVIQSIVTNFTVNPNTRANFVVGIGYNDSVTEAQELIQGALRDISGILQTPAPIVFAEDLGTSTVNIRVQFWYDRSQCDERLLKSKAISSTKEVLIAEGISLPDGAREIVFADTLKIEMIKDHQEVKAALEEKKQEIKQIANANLTKSAKTDDIPQGHEDDLREMAKTTNLPGHAPEDNLLKMQ